MAFPETAIPPMYRLTARAGVGLACDEQGIALGPAVVVEALAAGSGRVFRRRPADEIARTLALAYDDLAPPHIARCLSSLDLAAKALDAGDLANASVAAVLLKLPELSVDAFAKLAADPSLKKYSPIQPRDQRGRWTSDGPGSAGVEVEVAENDDGTRTDATDILRRRAGTTSRSPAASIAGSGGRGRGGSRPRRHRRCGRPDRARNVKLSRPVADEPILFHRDCAAD